MSAELAGRVAARLGELWGGAYAVGNVRRLSGGASRETWSLDATGPDGARHGLIVRRDPEELPRPEQMAREAAAFRAARAAGVPEPELYDAGPDRLGSPYLLMERLDGETIARRLLRDEAYAGARPRLARELGGVLARIHAIDPGEVPGLPRIDALPLLRELYEGFGEPRPAIELGLRWLAEHRPEAYGDTLVHGDFRTGNLLIGPDGLRGVLDWEIVHRGDPMQDLGWLCTKAWRFGSPHPVGGFGPRADLLAGYAEAGGTPPDPQTLAWWELYGTLRWAVLCRRQAERHLSGAEPSLELAVLGRRVCEQEHDILLSLGLTHPVTIPDPLTEQGAGDGGRTPPTTRPGGAQGAEVESEGGGARSAGGRGHTPPATRPGAVQSAEEESEGGGARSAGGRGHTPPATRPGAAQGAEEESEGGGARSAEDGGDAPPAQPGAVQRAEVESEGGAARSAEAREEGGARTLPAAQPRATRRIEVDGQGAGSEGGAAQSTEAEGQGAGSRDGAAQSTEAEGQGAGSEGGAAQSTEVEGQGAGSEGGVVRSVGGETKGGGGGVRSAVPHDLPDRDGLLEAVGEFLVGEMGAAEDPRVRFHARVAANAVRIARREARLAEAHGAAHRGRLASLGCADDGELCAAIRDGSLDGRAGEVAEVVRAAVTDKLIVANPAHLAIPG
ncbi:MAG TPA: phosphotransferase [Streptosporangiaceae bacterium]|jgi:aminoglycoside phosphotransferase (APT) family kinase protein